MKLIDKDALVAEIEKTRKALNLNLRHDQGVCDGLYAIRKYINYLDAKEVDLKKELEEWIKYGPHTNYPWCTIPDAIKITAEHFFELGLNAQKGEKYDTR